MYKYCIVPGCKVTTKDPGKIFIALPEDEKRRRLWLVASRIPLTAYSAKSRVHVCENHFNLEDDAENYIRLKYHKSGRIKLKPDVVPHIFKCQPERTHAQPRKGRPSSAKRARKSLVEGLIASACWSTKCSTTPVPSKLPSPQTRTAAETLCEFSIPRKTHCEQEFQTVQSDENKQVQQIKVATISPPSVFRKSPASSDNKSSTSCSEQDVTMVVIN